MVTFLNFEVSGLNSITGRMQTGLPQIAGSQELGRWRTTNWMWTPSKLLFIYLYVILTNGENSQTF